MLFLRYLATLIVAAWPLLAGAQAPEKKEVQIAVGGKTSLYYLPLTIAEQLGYFKDEGLVVSIADFAGGSQALRPSDISVIGVGLGATAIGALKSGQIDAVSNTDPVMTKLEQDGDVKIIADTRTLKGTERVLGGPMPAGCLYAPVDFIKKNPNTVQALANAIVRADKWIHSASPQDVLRTVPESYLLADKALYLFSFNKVKEAISPDGVISDAGARTALKVIPTFNPEVKAEEIKLELTYTNEFVKKANVKYK